MVKPKPISRDVGRFCFAHYIADDPSCLPGTSAISFTRSPAGVLVKLIKDEVSDPGQNHKLHSFVGQVCRGMQSLCARLRVANPIRLRADALAQ